MDTLFVVIIVVSLLAAAWMFVSSRFDFEVRMPSLMKAKGTDSASGKPSNVKWRSVRIHPSLISCPAVEKLKSQTYLSMDAPALPLQGCTEKKCNCKYVFLDDRRDSKERRDTPGYLSTLGALNQTDRRDSEERRNSDTQS